MLGARQHKLIPTPQRLRVVLAVAPAGLSTSNAERRNGAASPRASEHIPVASEHIPVASEHIPVVAKVVFIVCYVLSPAWKYPSHSLSASKFSIANMEKAVVENTINENSGKMVACGGWGREKR